jgi:hypothetical protein
MQTASDAVVRVFRLLVVIQRMPQSGWYDMNAGHALERYRGTELQKQRNKLDSASTNPGRLSRLQRSCIVPLHRARMHLICPSFIVM